MRKLLAVTLLLGLGSLPMMAQDNPRVEVFGGFQYLHVGAITVNGVKESNSQGYNGWNASGAGYLNKYFGVEGDVSGGYATTFPVSTHVYTYTGGPIVSANTGIIKPFAHALFGGIRVSNSSGSVSIAQTGFTMMVGGGVDARVYRALAVRIAQVDWLYYHFGNQLIGTTNIPSFSQSNNVRISTGLVFRF